MKYYLFKTSYCKHKHLLLFSCGRICIHNASLKLLPVKSHKKHEYINLKYNKLWIATANKNIFIPINKKYNHHNIPILVSIHELRTTKAGQLKIMS